jgi:hypothetical protein
MLLELLLLLQQLTCPEAPKPPSAATAAVAQPLVYAALRDAHLALPALVNMGVGL